MIQQERHDKNRALAAGSELAAPSCMAPSTVPDAFFQSLPIPMLLLGSDGRVCRSNLAAQQMLGSSAVQAEGLGISIAVRCIHALTNSQGCGASSSCENCSLRRLLVHTFETGCSQQRVEAKITVQRNGRQQDCHLLVSTSVVESSNGRQVLVCFEDVSARKFAELQLRKALHEVENLKAQLQSENRALREQITCSQDTLEIVGKSEELKLTLGKCTYAAASDANVVILGETGVGKELIARFIHKKSERRNGPLVTVNCCALPNSLFESDLFGHVAGAFTGAITDRLGRFELAHGGTIFLDEIAELSTELQAKLLRVIQFGEFERTGSSETTKVDVRIVAATNRNLQQAIAEGSFRSDLYYRLTVFPIEVPPLRDRREDIPLLAWHFVAKMQARIGKRIESIPEAAMHALTQYDWPGNIRELENVIERAVILSPGPVLRLDDVFVNTSQRSQSTGTGQDLNSVDREHITAVLESCRWKINGKGNAADRLGLNPSTLRSRMKKLGIERG